MIRLSLLTALFVAASTFSCATAPRSVLLGAGTGLVAGGGVGFAVGRDGTGTAIGAASGAVVGGVIGYFLHKGKNHDQTQSQGTDAEKYPFLTRPEVRTIWVPDAVEGNRYIERHRVFVIEKNSSWSKDND